MAKLAMIKHLSTIGLSLLLGACVPMAMFASSDNNYRTRLGVQIESANVNTLCMSPDLRLAIWEFEGRFGRKVVVSSGYRTPWDNRAVGGAPSSYHTRCMAADFFIPGVAKAELVKFARGLRIVGGLGCYWSRKFIHIDVRQRPRGYSQPVTWNC